MFSGPDALFDALRGCTRILLTGPADPDGDSVGACLAFARVLSARGVFAEVAGTPGWRYEDLPDASAMLPDIAIGAGWDAVVVLDGDRHRLAPNVLRAFNAARVRGIIDHHGSTTPDGYTHGWLQADATSTCAMVWDALTLWGLALDRDIAELLYVGTIFDTGGFRHGNTTPATHQLAATLLGFGIDHAAIGTRILAERRPCGLKATARIWDGAEFLLSGKLLLGIADQRRLGDLTIEQGDLEGVVDGLVAVTGVVVGALIIEREDRVKLSLRSHGGVDVAALAKSLTDAGGGHPRAAGASLKVSVDEARELLIHAVAAALT